MNKASNVKLSLRKLLTAMMAVGPLAILPAPVWATLPVYNAATPATNSFTIVNGSASVTKTGVTVATISTSDRAVLQWGSGNFNIASSEGYNFQMPAGGAVLNRVGTTIAADTALIAGQLDSNGKVFILANGTINIANGASITTSGGLVLSTLPEENGAFLATGDLLYVPSTTPALNGTINIGNTVASTLPVNVSGNFTAVGGTITHTASSITGDMVLKSVNSGNAITLVNVAGGQMLTGGNLSVTTNAGNIIQATGGGAITVGNNTSTQLANFTTGGGNNVITLNQNNANDFQVIKVNAGTGAGGNVDIRDNSNIVIGESIVGGALSVVVSGNTGKTDGQTGIGTNGMLTVVGNADFAIGVAAGVLPGAPAPALPAITGVARTNISIGNNSSVGGTINATLSNNNSFTFNGTGNITTGTISATGGNGTGVTVTTTGALVVGATISTSGNTANGGGGVSLRATNISPLATGIINAGTATNAGSVTLNATAGNVTTGTIAANRTLTLTAAAGNIAQTVGTTITTMNTTGLTNVYTAAGSVVLDSATNSFEGANIHQFASANATLVNTNSIVLGTSNVTNNLTLTSSTALPSPVTALPGILIGTGTGTGAQSITVGNVLSATVSNPAASINDNNYSAYNVFGGVNLVTAGGAATLDAAYANGGLAPAVRLGIVNATVPGGTLTVGESTTLNLGNITAANLIASSSQGGIIDTGNFTVTAASFTSNNSTGSTVLDNTGHSIGTLTVQGGVDNSVLLNQNVAVGTGTGSIIGNLTVATVAGSGKNITLNNTGVVGNLTLNSAGTIDVAGTVNVTGNASLTAASNATLTATTGGYLADSLPSLTLTTNVTNGQVGLTLNTLSDVLSFAGVPTLTISGGGAPTTPVAVTLAQGAFGEVLSATRTNNGAGYTVDPTYTISGPVVTSISQTAGTMSVTGNLILGSGAILDRANNFANLVLANTTGHVYVNDINDINVSGSSSGRVVAVAGANTATAPAPIANTWNVALGNLSVGGLTLYARNGGGGNSGTITQAAGTSVHSEAATTFNAMNNNIVLTNAGNSFGRISIAVTDTDGSRTVSVTEDGTMKVGGLASRGTTTLTSRTGSIIEDPDSTVALGNNGTLVLSAVAGSVLVGNTTKNGTFTTSGNVVSTNITASGAAAITSSANLSFGTTNVGALTVVSGNNIAQSQALKVYGAASFTATNNITLNNSGNNFGRVSLATTNATAVTGMRDISITENGTLNLGAVTMPAATTGNFTAVSTTGDIIDTGLAGLKPGGTTASKGSGLITLTASKGNIVLDDPTTDFPTTGGIVFNANNVTLSPLGSSAIYLGGVATTSTVAGNLVVTSAIGDVLSKGNITVTGDAMFQAGNGNITLAQSGNAFGSLKFTGNQVAIVESNDMAIVTGSSALGSAQLSSGGNITVANRGGTINFNNTVFLSATGGITLPKVVQAVGTLTLNAAGVKDLSLLSKSGDLNNKEPNNLGSGTYLPPLP